MIQSKVFEYSLYPFLLAVGNQMQMRVASFFAGIGGFDLGFERAGMDVVFQCEKNSFALNVLENHWPQVQRHSDIETLSPNSIPDADLYCGGFPCQDVSLANQGKRLGLKGDRSGLFYKFAELIEVRRPRWVVIENVVGLLNSQQGNDFRVVIGKLDEFGYGVGWRVLDAKYFGTPQRRRRIFIVASYRSLSAAAILFDEERITIPIETSRGSEQALSGGVGEDFKESNLYSIQHAGVGRNHRAGPQGRGYRNDGETWTFDHRGSADVVCSTDDPFGIRDTAGFPIRMDRHRYQAIGNAVCVPIVEWLGRRIIAVENYQNTLESVELPDNILNSHD
jgi:DNA (cytosine-5)-methyltransferase 1